MFRLKTMGVLHARIKIHRQTDSVGWMVDKVFVWSANRFFKWETNRFNKQDPMQHASYYTQRCSYDSNSQVGLLFFRWRWTSVKWVRCGQQGGDWWQPSGGVARGPRQVAPESVTEAQTGPPAGKERHSRGSQRGSLAAAGWLSWQLRVDGGVQDPHNKSKGK